MIRIATVFSGIGAVEHALCRLGLQHEIVFACDNGERILRQDLSRVVSAKMIFFKTINVILSRRELTKPAILHSERKKSRRYYYETER